MKKLSFLITVVLIFLISSNTLAESKNIIFWQKAEMYLLKNNDTLFSMAENERRAKDQYLKTVDATKAINTEGMKIDIMGSETYIGYDQSTQMLLSQQKELLPQQMKFSWDMASKTYITTENGMIIGLRNMYLGLFSAKNENEIKQKKYELAQRIHKQDAIKFERGLISDIDLLESEYNLTKSTMEADEAKRNYDNMLRSFNAFIGVDINTKYDEVVYEEKSNSKKIEALEYYISKSMESRIEVFGVKNNIELLEQKKTMMEKYPMSLNTVSVREDYDSIPSEIESAKLSLEQTKLNIQKEIKDAYVDVTIANKSVTGVKKALDLQYTNLVNMRAKFKKGLISSTMLDQIEIAYEELENSYKAALYDYNTKFLKLQNATGIGPGYKEN